MSDWYKLAFERIWRRRGKRQQALMRILRTQGGHAISDLAVSILLRREGIKIDPGNYPVWRIANPLIKRGLVRQSGNQSLSLTKEGRELVDNAGNR